jgi:hypothetical protein
MSCRTSRPMVDDAGSFGRGNMLAGCPQDDCELARRLYDLADWTVAIGIRAMSSLGLADAIGDGSVSAEVLAQRCGVQAGSLHRILNILVRAGALVESPPHHFVLTPALHLLRQDHPFSMRDAYLLSAVQMRIWAALDYSLRTGRPAFDHVFGESHRAFRLTHAEEDVRMDRAHRAATRVEAEVIKRLLDWSHVRMLVDVGGGTGVFAASLLRAFKDMRAIVFELPRMAADARAFMEECGLADRCQAVAGNFFESIPAAADVYILKSVIGGWDDDAAGQILRNIRSAMREDSRLLVIEPILRDDEKFTFGNVVHLESLLLYGGPDRRLQDYEEMLSRAGLRIADVVQRPTLPLLKVVTA